MRNVQVIDMAIQMLQKFREEAQSGDPIRCEIEAHNVGICPDPIASAKQDREVMMNLGGKYAVIMITRPNATVESVLNKLHPLIEA